MRPCLPRILQYYYSLIHYYKKPINSAKLNPLNTKPGFHGQKALCRPFSHKHKQNTMNKRTLFLLCSLLLSLQLSAQEKKIFNETPEQKQKRLAWWTNDRFGMFIH